MARMLPSHIDPSVLSTAECRIFELLKNDLQTKYWVVLHSLGLSNRGSKPYGEIDFVALIPGEGIFCLEVKGGRIACRNGRWETTDRHGRTEGLKRSPFIQAREGMFALRESILNRALVNFPTDLIFGYAVVMPNITFNQQSPEWQSWQIIDRNAMKQPMSSAILRLAAEQRKYHRPALGGEPTQGTVQMLQYLLRPDFEFVMTRGAQIEETEVRLLHLTEEQFDVLDLLADNERCLFEGAAGTGKTMLAIEYARRSAMAGQRTLLVCYNRLLGDWLERQSEGADYSNNLHAGSYFKLLRRVILSSTHANKFLEQEKIHGQTSKFYEEVYPLFGLKAVKEVGELFDVCVIDEAQDLLKSEILNVLNSWLKGGLTNGRWAVFGDFHRQAIFGSTTGLEIKRNLNKFSPQFAKGRLVLNCRNTRNIGEETALLSGFTSPPYKMEHILGTPVDYRYYDSTESQHIAISEVIHQLLADGIKPGDIIALSRLRFQNSGVFNAGDDSFRIIETDEGDAEQFGIPCIRFITIQAFKGMESPVVILCDVDEVSNGDSQCLLYTAMSRARSQLTVLVHDSTKTSIIECIKRKMQEGWNKDL